MLKKLQIVAIAVVEGIKPGVMTMIQLQRATFGFIERMSRLFIGFILLIVSFTIAMNSEWFITLNFVALYPLLTALVAWDPIYMIIEVIKERWVDFWLLR